MGHSWGGGGAEPQTGHKGSRTAPFCKSSIPLAVPLGTFHPESKRSPSVQLPSGSTWSQAATRGLGKATPAPQGLGSRVLECHATRGLGRATPAPQGLGLPGPGVLECRSTLSLLQPQKTCPRLLRPASSFWPGWPDKQTTGSHKEEEGRACTPCGLRSTHRGRKGPACWAAWRGGERVPGAFLAEMSPELSQLCRGPFPAPPPCVPWVPAAWLLQHTAQ